MTVVPQRVLDLVHGIDAFDRVLDDIDAEWRPDPAPLTTSMSDVGRAFAESAKALHITELTTVFQRLEAILRDGEEEEKNAASTGFIEAMAAVLDQFPERRWILQHAGEEARHYLFEWDRFCGVVDD
jgi:hypothetical protein